eukprot:scaffold124751_cov44-Phaeocystis_antarctica.AAC.2
MVVLMRPYWCCSVRDGSTKYSYWSESMTQNMTSGQPSSAATSKSSRKPSPKWSKLPKLGLTHCGNW